MKKVLFLSLLLVLTAITAPVCADVVDPRLLSYANDISASGGKTITANIPASSSRKIVIWHVIGRSDLSTSAMQLQEANASGTTTNYTTIVKWDVGEGTAQRSNQGAPLFVGKIGYGYRILLDSTTANSLIIIYSYN